MTQENLPIPMLVDLYVIDPSNVWHCFVFSAFGVIFLKPDNLLFD